MSPFTNYFFILYVYIIKSQQYQGVSRLGILKNFFAFCPLFSRRRSFATDFAGFTKILSIFFCKLPLSFLQKMWYGIYWRDIDFSTTSYVGADDHIRPRTPGMGVPTRKTDCHTPMSFRAKSRNLLAFRTSKVRRSFDALRLLRMTKRATTPSRNRMDPILT